ncbi:MAG TPA: cupin domain-containing protein [Candidatus Polarisedimenticolia bacterium]|nr:cupin domain-containing protein [Candidatus Polarisedimenticolia bacterium]
MLGAVVFGLALAAEGAHPHVIENLAEASWGPAPNMLPPGAQIEVLGGNPMGDSLFTVRLKFPAGYRIPAHSHPRDEHVTVLSGKLHIGMGDKLDPAGGKALGVGGFGLMPANANHFAYCNEATTILLHGWGPIEFKYVNPADDPRNQKAAS